MRKRYRLIECHNEYLVTEEPRSLEEALELARRNFDPRLYSPEAGEGTCWVDLVVYEDHWDPDNEEWRQVGETGCTLAVHPREPRCAPGRQHEWRHVKVAGHGAGLVYTEACSKCGRYRGFNPLPSGDGFLTHGAALG